LTSTATATERGTRPDITADDAKRPERGDGDLRIWAFAVIALSLAAQLILVFTKHIDGDEFLYLSRVYTYGRGELSAPLQNLHVHFFGWLPWLSDSEIDQIIAARLLMLVIEAATLALIYVSARRFASRDATLFGVVCYAAFNYVVAHGASFRTDPPATMLLMSAVALLLASPLRWPHTVAGGAAVAIAGLVTIKAVFYLPVIVALAAWRIMEAPDRRAMVLRLAIGGAASVAVFALVFEMHAASLAGAHVGNAAAAAGGSFNKVMTAETIFLTWPYLLIAVSGSPLTFAAIGAGAWGCAREARASPGAPRRQALVLLAFAFPVATLLFYHNSYPYYYAFILPPACVLAATAFDWIGWNDGRLKRVLALAGAFVALQFAVTLSPGQRHQRELLASVHETFPAPVPYIGPNSMVSAYPQVAFFMSTWGLESYRAAGRPVLRDAIARASPLFVIVKNPALATALLPGRFDFPDAYRLLAEDEKALRENYIQHRGDLWVAGKALKDLAADEARTVRFLIPGNYRVESPSPIAIDGMAHAPGDVATLSAGSHVLKSGQGLQNVTLRWADLETTPDRPR